MKEKLSNDSKTLILLHKNLLLIMEEIKRICEENQISYFLDSGTALGAIRHGGFIPWDDDADIGMLYSEYIKFKNVCLNGGLKEGFYLQCIENDSNYCDPWIRIRLDNTFFATDKQIKYKFKHLGVFVDIFPYLNCDFQSLKVNNKIIKKIKAFNILFHNKVCKCHETFKSKFLHLFVILIPMKFIFNKRKKLLSILGNNESKYVVSSFILFDNYWIKKEGNQVFEKQILSDVKKAKFEDKTFCIVNNFDYFLKKLYGNYMKMPPVEDRGGHGIKNAKLLDI